MLTHTFVHIPGIGARTERELWHQGITSWNYFDDFFTQPVPISAALRRRLNKFVPDSIDAVAKKDAKFFARLSQIGEAWRLYPEFAAECVFLDIETTGLSTVFDTVTMVGLFDGTRYEVFIDGQNLHEVPERLRNYSVVVTFNGSGFDLRFLRLAFKDIQLPPIHIDLRWVTRRLGYRGGLKSIEREFGLHRDDSVSAIDGLDATVLWSRHLRGDRSALRELVAYNTADVVHLKAIMEMAYDRLAKQLYAGVLDQSPIHKGVRSPRTPKFQTRRATPTGQALVPHLLQRLSVEAPKIVGIDLTGSERRATGWALMEGSNAITKSLSTDAELMNETIAARPDVVSIDSPLSVPDGWSLAQEQLVPESPIYRKCELALKRMGISVFWALLPSMRSLTARGIRLADELRRHGLKVIESYPGAAQDILGIPRKGSSLEELKKGLRRAGIRGRYLNTAVSHDEVDAITSALVGLFYLADDYIALGTPSENYLVVPRSSRINYEKLAAIVDQTGLDPVFSENRRGLECKLERECPLSGLAT